jgi:hypothetical protein
MTFFPNSIEDLRHAVLLPAAGTGASDDDPS